MAQTYPAGAALPAQLTPPAATPVVTPAVAPAAVSQPIVPAAQPTAPAAVSQSSPFQMSFSPQEFMDIWETMDVASKDPASGFDSAAQGFASSLVETLVYDPYYKGKMDYNTLRLGTAPILQELGIDGGLTDEQIIEIFAIDDKGAPVVSGPAAIEGFKREILGDAVSTGGFYAGMYGGNAMVSGVSPLTAWGAAIRVGTPIITGLVSAVTGKAVGDAATDLYMDPEPLIIPGTKTEYEMGKTASHMLGYVVTPWAIPKGGANLGGRIALNNLQNFMGPVLNRAPISARVVGGIESMTEKLATRAAVNPYGTALVEVGAYGGTVGGAGLAEANSPDNPWVRFGFEMAGGVGTGVATDIAVNTMPAVLKWSGKGLYNLFNKVRGKSTQTDLQLQYGLSEDELKTAGNFIIEQLEKNAEDPNEILKVLNDPSFNRWLVDEDGVEIELDAATKAASVTLLALQHQFMDAAPGGAQQGSKATMTDAVSALRRALLAMYADGSETALGDAALVQTGLFEGVLDSKLAAAFDNMQKSMRQVRPDGENVDIAAADAIFTLLEGQYRNGRNAEELLWKRIPQDVVVTSFINEQGVTTSTPNFITKWAELLGNETPEIKAAILKSDDLTFLQQFVLRKTEELGLAPTEAPTAQLLPALAEQKVLDKALNKIAGTDNANFVDETLSQLRYEEASPQAMMEQLRKQAKEALEPEVDWSGFGSSPKSLPVTKEQKQLAAAFDAQASLIAAQENQAKAFAGQAADAAAETGEIVGLQANELVRSRGRALAMGRRLSAAGYNEEARIANEMADAMMSDLNSMGVGISQAYDTARSYSRAFNDVFTRSYGGEVLGTKRNGAPKIPIATLANNMMRGDAAFMRAQQLDGIAQFEVTQSLTNLLISDTLESTGEVAGLSAAVKATGKDLLEDFNQSIDPSTGILDMRLMRAWYGRNKEAILTVPNLNTRITDAMNGSTQLRSAEETLVRTVRANTLNPDGTLNVGALSNWRNNANNERLLNLFPALKSDLDDVTKAATLLEATQQSTAAELKAAKGTLGLYELLPDKTANAATVISRALSDKQPRPWQVMDQYVRMIDNIGEEGFTVTSSLSPNAGQTWTQQELRDGLRTAIYDSIFQVKSNGTSFRPDVAYNTLFTKHPNGSGKTIAEYMLDNKLIGADQLKDTKKFLREMGKISAFNSTAKEGQTDVFFQDVGEGVKILASMGGSIAGTNLRQMFGGGGSGDLIAAGRGASMGQRLAQKYMAELPQSLQASRVAIILENPALLKQVLRVGRSAREKNALVARLQDAFINNYLVSPTRRVGVEAIQTATPDFGAIEGEVIQPSEVQAPAAVPPQLQAPVQTPPPVQAPIKAPVQNMNTPTNPSRFQQPQAAAPTSSGPVDRERYAALFPEDRALMAGIGSLGGVA